MKTKILISVLCACSLFQGQAQEWGYVDSLTEEWLRKICTQGLDTVYVVGENGLIARSIDQGKSWQKQYSSNQAALNDIIFIDHNTGLAVGELGTILKTTDAGDTWSQIALDITFPINAIAATGPDNIWAVGNNSLILHSVDIGETWVRKNILPENNRQLTDVAFRGNLGYFTGNYAIVYKTEDFGITWNKQIVDTYVENFVNDHNHYYSLNVMDNTVYLLNNYHDYSLFLMEEGEVNWMKKETPRDNRSKVCFVNDSTGYIIEIMPVSTCCGPSISLNDFAILKTINGGSDWEGIVYGKTPENYHNPMDYFYFDIKFANDTIGYAIIGTTIMKIPMEKAEPREPQLIANVINSPFFTLYQEANDLVISSDMINSVELLNIYGRRLEKKYADNHSFCEKIDVSCISSGVYLVKVNLSSGKMYTKKWIKK